MPPIIRLRLLIQMWELLTCLTRAYKSLPTLSILDVVPATVEFVDIAGLVKGANEEKVLATSFSPTFAKTDAICEVVRYFSDPDVVHVEGR